MDALTIVAQRQSMDCGVAALATLCGLDYEDVYVAATKIAPRVGKVGLYQKELVAIAQMLGVTLERVRPRAYDLDASTGILNVRSARLGHYVVIHDGVVADPAGGRVYFDIHDYLALGKFSPRTLLARKD